MSAQIRLWPAAPALDQVPARVHFAGLNGAQWAQETEGRDVLVSYADIVRRPGVWARDLRPRLEAGAYRRAILDSGAFTVLSQGMRISVRDYGRFAAETQGLWDEIVTLDDIAGDLATTWRNTATLRRFGLDPLVVFHQGEPWEVLDHYAETCGRIGVGFARRPGGKLVGGCRRFLLQFFDRLADRAQAHGFGMTRWATKERRPDGSRFPFAWVDSTTWIAEYRAMLAGDASGPLVDLVERHGNPARLVLDSYSHQGDPARSPFDLVERHSIGQARTALRRFGPALADQLVGIAS